MTLENVCFLWYYSNSYDISMQLPVELFLFYCVFSPKKTVLICKTTCFLLSVVDHT